MLLLLLSGEAFKDSSPAETREKMWKDMRGRIERKIYFPLLEGNGWPYAPGPLVFKCDQAPKNFRGERGQWGRNISTGESAHASPTFPFGKMSLRPVLFVEDMPEPCS